MLISVDDQVLRRMARDGAQATPVFQEVTDAVLAGLDDSDPALRARLLIARAGYTDDPAAAAATDEAAALASDHQLAEVEGLLLRREALVYSDPRGGMRTSNDRMLRAHDALVTAGFEFETAACARFDTVERLRCPAFGFRIRSPTTRTRTPASTGSDRDVFRQGVRRLPGR